MVSVIKPAVDVIKPEKHPKQGLFEKDEKYWGRVAAWKKREAARKEGKRIARPGQVMAGGGHRLASKPTHTSFPSKTGTLGKTSAGIAIGNKSLSEPQKGTKDKP